MTNATKPPTRRAALDQDGSRATRRVLVDAATRVCLERGHDQVTINDVCRTAGVTRTTFYFHYESRDALLTDVAVSTAADVMRAMQERMGRTDDPVDAIRHAIGGLAKALSQYPREFVAVMVPELQRSANRLPVFREEHDDFEFVVTQAFNRGRDAGRFRTDLDPRDFAAVLTSTVVCSILDWAEHADCRTHLADILAPRCELILQGALPATTPELPLVEWPPNDNRHWSITLRGEGEAQQQRTSPDPSAASLADRHRYGLGAPVDLGSGQGPGERAIWRSVGPRLGPA